MNEYQMIRLAADRSHEFHAEAQRRRLADIAKARRSERKAQPRRWHRFDLGSLLRRPATSA